jgi:hypothetical protein
MLLSDSRRLIRLIHPATQMRSALAVLGVSLLFGVILAWNCYYAFAHLHHIAAATADPAFKEQFAAQIRTFMQVSGLILIAYVLAMVGTCVALTHRLLGPTVALGRHVQSLKNGNYRFRIHLRKSDGVFQPLAQELNQLTEILARNGRSDSGSL